MANLSYIKTKRQRVRRERLLELLGEKCATCGFTDPRALQLDHKNGNGHRDWTSSRNQWEYYDEIIALIEAGSEDFQILCANCNLIKRVVMKEYRKSR